MYLTFNMPEGRFLGLLTFIPQLSIAATIGVAFGKDIFFCTFLQTFVFVLFNKVVTAQVRSKFSFLYDPFCDDGFLFLFFFSLFLFAHTDSHFPLHLQYFMWY